MFEKTLVNPTVQLQRFLKLTTKQCVVGQGDFPKIYTHRPVSSLLSDNKGLTAHVPS